MKRSTFWIILVGAVILAMFPDLFGLVDELIYMMVIVVDTIIFLSTKAKAARDAVALLASDAPTQSS